MNPYDANTHPGTHLVAEELGVSDVSTLNIAYRPDEPLYRATTWVIGTAYELDERHNRVTHAAQSALQLPEPVGRGELGGARVSYALLRTAVSQIGDLHTRHDRAYDQLVEAVSTYRRLLPESDTAQRSTTKTHQLHQEQRSGRNDDWAIAGDRRLMALEAVAAGGLRFRLTAIGNDPHLSDGTGRRPQPLAATVQRLVADGLLQQDTSENLYRSGELLSLTPQGEAALRDARTATPRVSAALSRTNTPAKLGPIDASAALPVTTTADEPSRSR
ncbi:large ATP-binding protein [Streptomyces sp. NPDC093109]|uniref:large ATP-binding protein n=1 Tax=Streptomyces sp. NPDC093109 TaxID=3154977 RepID=UPI00344C215A